MIRNILGKRVLFTVGDGISIGLYITNVLSPRKLCNFYTPVTQLSPQNCI
jgi:hypothetical protein